MAQQPPLSGGSLAQQPPLAGESFSHQPRYEVAFQTGPVLSVPLNLNQDDVVNPQDAQALYYLALPQSPANLMTLLSSLNVANPGQDVATRLAALNLLGNVSNAAGTIIVAVPMLDLNRGGVIDLPDVGLYWPYERSEHTSNTPWQAEDPCHTDKIIRHLNMEALAFDTHKFVKHLTESGFTEAQAEALAGEQVDMINSNLATREDIEKLRADTRADIANTESRLTRWIIGAMIAQIGVVVGLIKLS